MKVSSIIWLSSAAVFVVALTGCSAGSANLTAEICDDDFRSELIGPELETEQGAANWVLLYDTSRDISSDPSSTPEEKTVARVASDWFFAYGYDIETGRGWGSMSAEWADLGLEFGAACNLVD